MSASREKQLRQEQAASGYVDPKTLEEQARQKKEKRSNRLYALIGVVFLVAVVISVTVLGEALRPLQILGGSLILGFTLWNELPGRKEK